MSYYGGKQRLADFIARLIDLSNYRRYYIEVFCGGASVFFAKRSIADVEVLNDLAGDIHNFWQTLRDSPDELLHKLRGEMYSARAFRKAVDIANNPDAYNEVNRAWATMFSNNASFVFNARSFAPDKHNSFIAKVNRVACAQQRLQETIVTQKNAVDLISEYTNETDCVFYCDPPYIDSHQNYKHKYTQAQYDRLLDMLSHIKGGFVLSSYPNESLTAAVEKNNWRVTIKEMICHAEISYRASAGKDYAEMKGKQEVVVWGGNGFNDNDITPDSIDKLKAASPPTLL